MLQPPSAKKVKTENKEPSYSSYNEVGLSVRKIILRFALAIYYNEQMLDVRMLNVFIVNLTFPIKHTHLHTTKYVYIWHSSVSKTCTKM